MAVSEIIGMTWREALGRWWARWRRTHWQDPQRVRFFRKLLRARRPERDAVVGQLRGAPDPVLQFVPARGAKLATVIDRDAASRVVGVIEIGRNASAEDDAAVNGPEAP